MLSEMRDIWAENWDVAAKNGTGGNPNVRPLRFRTDQSTKTGNDIFVLLGSQTHGERGARAFSWGLGAVPLDPTGGHNPRPPL